MPPFDVLLGAFGAGIYVIVAVTHLDLWSRRRGNVGHLWLALTSASACVVDVTGIAAAFAPAASVDWLAALNLLGVAGATVSLLELASALSQSRTGPWLRIQQALTVVLAPAVFVVPSLSAPVLASCAVLISASVLRAWMAARAPHDSRQPARAFLFLAGCLLSDLAKELAGLPIPNNLPLLGFTVLFLATARSLNEQFEREHDASRRDALTGLANRRRLLEAWEEAVLRGRRSGRPLTIALADLDHFKRINDARGHAAGDAALVAVAGILRSSLRGQDLVARWGGEEFMLLLPDTDAAGARHVAEAIRQALGEAVVPGGGEPLRLTVSIGICEHRPGASMDDTLAGADEALYRAKAAGRNRVVAIEG